MVPCPPRKVIPISQPAQTLLLYWMSLRREKVGSIFFLYLVTFTLSTWNKMDGQASARPFDISSLIDQGPTQSLGEENQNPVGPPWKHGLVTWLTSFKPERRVPLMEELDVAFNYEIGVELENSSESWCAGQLHNECIHEDCGWIARVRCQVHDFPRRHLLLKVWVVYAACCEAPVLVHNSSVLIQSYPASLGTLYSM